MDAIIICEQAQTQRSAFVHHGSDHKKKNRTSVWKTFSKEDVINLLAREKAEADGEIVWTTVDTAVFTIIEF